MNNKPQQREPILTKEQKTTLMAKLDQFKNSKVSHNEILNSIEDTMEEMAREAIAYADEAEKLINHWRSTATRLENELNKLKKEHGL